MNIRNTTSDYIPGNNIMEKVKYNQNENGEIEIMSDDEEMKEVEDQIMETIDKESIATNNTNQSPKRRNTNENNKTFS